MTMKASLRWIIFAFTLIGVLLLLAVPAGAATADLSISKVDARSLVAGSNITYTISVANAGQMPRRTSPCRTRRRQVPRSSR